MHAVDDPLAPFDGARPWFRGERVVILHDGTRLTTTRGHRDDLNTLLGKADRGD